jgi:hypothetical protein
MSSNRQPQIYGTPPSIEICKLRGVTLLIYKSLLASILSHVSRSKYNCIFERCELSFWLIINHFLLSTEETTNVTKSYEPTGPDMGSGTGKVVIRTVIRELTFRK